MFALLFYVTLFFLFVTLLSCAVYVSRFNDACRAEHIAKSQRDMWIGRHERLSASYDKRTVTISELKEDRADLRKLSKLRGEEIESLKKHYDEANNTILALQKTQVTEATYERCDPDIDDKEIEKLQDDIAAFVKITDSWVKFSKQQTTRIASLETAAQNDAQLRKKLRSEVKSLKEKIGIANAL